MTEKSRNKGGLERIVKIWPMIAFLCSTLVGTIWWGATVTADIAMMKQQIREIHDYVLPKKSSSDPEPQESKMKKYNRPQVAKD